MLAESIGQSGNVTGIDLDLNALGRAADLARFTRSEGTVAILAWSHETLLPGYPTLERLFEMRWPGVESELFPEVRAEYRRLCLSDSPDSITRRSDYGAFFTYTMFHGVVR